jgi:hypothetical protein
VNLGLRLIAELVQVNTPRISKIQRAIESGGADAPSVAHRK